jgi:CheY-like chemotaxis protein
MSEQRKRKAPPVQDSKDQSRETVRRVLVVEDHEDTRFMLRTILEMNGYLVLDALDGETAIGLVQEEKPDLVLMDLSLPGMDGVEATRRIRGKESIRDVPIILVSGRAEPGARRDAHAAGCSNYLIKPVEIDYMMSVIDSYFVPRARSVA